jgi:hypothetical protein
MNAYPGAITLDQTDETYEVWEQSRTKDGWQPLTRRHPGNQSLPLNAAKHLADDYNEDQKYHDRYLPEGSEPSTRYVVVKATTTFEEMT